MHQRFKRPRSPSQAPQPRRFTPTVVRYVLLLASERFDTIIHSRSCGRHVTVTATRLSFVRSRTACHWLPVTMPCSTSP
jgi:hypothetical protein